MSESRVASITALQPGAHLLPMLPRSEQISDFDLSVPVPVRHSVSVLDWDVDLDLRRYPAASAGAGSIPA